MSSSTLPRPSQVTLAGWMIILGSVFVVFSVIELLLGMRSLETRESVEAFLAEPPGDGLGLDVEAVLGLWRVAAMVTAGCATAAAVLGWHVLQRNRGARVGLTVLAVPLFVAGVATGGFLSSLVAAASLMLWLQPARDWFDGKQAPRVEPLAPGRLPDARTGTGPSPHGSGQPDDSPGPTTPPRPYQGFGDPSATASLVPGPGMPAVHGGQPVPLKRPDSVLVAALVTWAVAGLTMILSAATSVAVLARPDLALAELRRQDPELLAQEGVTESLVVTTTAVLGGMMALWALLAIVLAFLTLRRRPAAAAALLVSASFTALFCLLGAIVSPPLILPAAGALVVALILRRPDVRTWLLAGRPRPGGVRPPR